MTRRLTSTPASEPPIRLTKLRRQSILAMCEQSPSLPVTYPRELPPVQLVRAATLTDGRKGPILVNLSGPAFRLRAVLRKVRLPETQARFPMQGCVPRCPYTRKFLGPAILRLSTIRIIRPLPIQEERPSFTNMEKTINFNKISITVASTYKAMIRNL